MERDVLRTEIEPYAKPGVVVEFREVDLREVDLAQELVRSHFGGYPYCEKGREHPRDQHGNEREFVFQVNTNDVHQALRPQGLFVAYRDGHVEYFARPEPARALIPDAMQLAEHPYHDRIEPIRDQLFWPARSMVEVSFPEKLISLPDFAGRYFQLCRRSPEHGALFEDHVGGYHQTYFGREFTPEECPECHARPQLIAQITPGDWSNSIWACANHPEWSFYAFHK